MNITAEEYNAFNLTKRSRIVLEEGKYLGDMVDGNGVYSLSYFWVITDEDLMCGNLPSYVTIRSAVAVKEKPYIDSPFDEDDEIKIDK